MFSNFQFLTLYQPTFPPIYTFQHLTSLPEQTSLKSCLTSLHLFSAILQRLSKKQPLGKFIKSWTSPSMVPSFSILGGGRQRIAIARALICNPTFIIADEPTSSLDVSIQAQILNLLKELKNNFNLTMMFISHNLSVINFICDRIAIMYFGRIIEILPKNELFTNNYHYYTKKLIEAIPKGKRIIIIPKLITEKDYRLNYEGCIYYYRCENAKEKCLKEIPKLSQLSSDHYAACHFPII